MKIGNWIRGLAGAAVFAMLAIALVATPGIAQEHGGHGGGGGGGWSRGGGGHQSGSRGGEFRGRDSGRGSMRGGWSGRSAGSPSRNEHFGGSAHYYGGGGRLYGRPGYNYSAPRYVNHFQYRRPRHYSGYSGFHLGFGFYYPPTYIYDVAPDPIYVEEPQTIYEESPPPVIEEREDSRDDRAPAYDHRSPADDDDDRAPAYDDHDRRESDNSGGIEVNNEPPAGCYYYDDSCGRKFSNLDDYTEHLQSHHHAETITVVDERSGRTLRTLEFVSGYWQVRQTQ